MENVILDRLDRAHLRYSLGPNRFWNLAFNCLQSVLFGHVSTEFEIYGRL